MWAKILNLAAECLFNFGLFYPQNFLTSTQLYFISSVIGRNSTKCIICNGLDLCFELGLGWLGRSNQVKSKKDLDGPYL